MMKAIRGEVSSVHRRSFILRLALAAAGIAVFGLIPAANLLAAEESSPARKRWDSYSEAEKERLMKSWDELQKMSRDDQAEMRAALERYSSFSPEQKREVDVQYERWKKLSPDAKDEIRAAFTEWQAHSEDEKDAFRLENKELQKEGKGAKPAK